jgi:hypothetical protein
MQLLGQLEEQAEMLVLVQYGRLEQLEQVWGRGKDFGKMHCCNC